MVFFFLGKSDQQKPFPKGTIRKISRYRIIYFFHCTVFEEIDDNDKALEQCINEIILQLTNVKSMIETNEATRCEFISSILHASIAITRRLTNKEINIELQRDISGEEASG